MKLTGDVIKKAMFKALLAAPDIRSILAKYGNSSAIFSTQPVPEDATFPMIIITSLMPDQPMDTKNSRGRVFRRDVKCYDVKAGDDRLVADMTEKVRTLFHRNALTVEGFTVNLVDVTGPMETDTEEAYGRTLSIRIEAEEN